jgi:hypothetical protein
VKKRCAEHHERSVGDLGELGLSPLHHRANTENCTIVCNLIVMEEAMIVIMVWGDGDHYCHAGHGDGRRGRFWWRVV